MKKSKSDWIRELRLKGILKEECPERDYWRFSVMKPKLLPKELIAEYEKLGEIRW